MRFKPMTLLIKISLLFSCWLFVSKVYCQENSYDPTHLYPVNELQTDFKFLRNKLEKLHPNLYLYTPKKNFNLFFDSIYNSIKNPLTETDFYNLITLLNSKIKDGHTMFLPGEAASGFINKGKFFPFDIFISNNKLYINKNYSSDILIKEGSEILSVNGIASTDILNYLLRRQIRDGNNQTYSYWILTNYFKQYFSFSFGQPSAFSVTFKTNNIDSQKESINALSKDSIKFYKLHKYPDTDSNENKQITFEINKQSNVAILTIKSFDSDILNTVYKQPFSVTLQKVFAQINSLHIKNLILDVRNNQGGDFESIENLLSYLLLQPVKFLPGSEQYKIIQPKYNGFKGNLIILINGGSFSATAILCSYLNYTKRGTFIGEETAGNKVIISGDAIDVTLPKTKIACEISTKKYIILDSVNVGHGVVPEYSMSPSVVDIISGNDPVKKFAYQLISKIK